MSFFRNCIVSCPAARSPRRTWLAVLTSAALLAACGGGASSSNSSSNSPSSTAAVASATSELFVSQPPAPDAANVQAAVPSYHLAPVLLDAPGAADALDNAGSANLPPRVTLIPEQWRGAPTSRLTPQELLASARPAASALPYASSSTAVTYTPAQIRSAYALPSLPATGSTVSATQAAQMGAGQTVYIVDAMSDPNVAAELSAFDQAFGLPGCTTQTIAVNASLPLARAASTGCVLSVVYSTTSGAMTTTAPSYNSGWATEIALDVQWVHATAPYARIVLIEAPDASTSSLDAAVALANEMGNGVVSMSFGAAEGSWTASVDSAFTGSGMTYLAATGDSGAGVSWPAVSTHVLAVGGTTLTYSGSGTRSEIAWSDTGGGVSQYTAAPSYQSNSVPGMGTQAYRHVGDVSFNADPYSGQYLATITPGSSSVTWLSAGGTSLATPQWAALIAIANAQRAAAGVAALGDAHALLYGQVASVPGNYAADLADITKGSDGSCSTCSAKVGYDTPTGLGTPNGTSLLAALAGTPVVGTGSVSGKVGIALSFTASVSSPDAVTLSLSGAPSGMAINSSDVVTWAAPVAGTYAVTVTAKDTRTGMSGQGTYTVTIAAPTPPTVGSATVSGRAGVALSYQVAVTAPDAVTLSLTGAPQGLSISSTGLVSWPSPVKGSYSVTVVAKDATTGLSASGVLSVSISTPTPPSVPGGTVQATSGVALSFNVNASGQDTLSYTLSGAPSGMSISSAGVVGWPSPVSGTYKVVVTAKDATTNLSAQGTYTVQVAVGGPVITAAAMSGVAGKALTGTISLSDAGATAISVSIQGVPLGMSLSASGMTITAKWPSPVTGSYALQVKATDAAGRTAQATVPITIAN